MISVKPVPLDLTGLTFNSVNLNSKFVSFEKTRLMIPSSEQIISAFEAKQAHSVNPQYTLLITSKNVIIARFEDALIHTSDSKFSPRNNTEDYFFFPYSDINSITVALSTTLSGPGNNLFLHTKSMDTIPLHFANKKDVLPTAAEIRKYLP